MPPTKDPDEAIKDKIKIDDNGCWVWQGYRLPNNYGQIRHKNITYLAHRFSYKTFVGSIDNKIICHKCDNPPCVNPEHLFEGTMSDNVSDMIWKGRFLNKEANWWSDETVVGIKRLYKTGKYTQTELSRRYGISQSTICRWVNNKKRQFAGCEINPNCLKE